MPLHSGSGESEPPPCFHSHQMRSILQWCIMKIGSRDEPDPAMMPPTKLWTLLCGLPSSVPETPQNSQTTHDGSTLFCPSGRLVPKVSNGDSWRTWLMTACPTKLSGRASVGVASRWDSNSGFGWPLKVWSVNACGICRSSVQSQ